MNSSRREGLAKRLRVEQGRPQEGCGTMPDAVKAEAIMRTLTGSADDDLQPTTDHRNDNGECATTKTYTPLHPRGALHIRVVGAFCRYLADVCSQVGLLEGGRWSGRWGHAEIRVVPRTTAALRKACWVLQLLSRRTPLSHTVSRRCPLGHREPMTS